jgi:hypothetical protein
MTSSSVWVWIGIGLPLLAAAVSLIQILKKSLRPTRGPKTYVWEFPLLLFGVSAAAIPATLYADTLAVADGLTRLELSIARLSARDLSISQASIDNAIPQRMFSAIQATPAAHGCSVRAIRSVFVPPARAKDDPVVANAFPSYGCKLVYIFGSPERPEPNTNADQVAQRWAMIRALFEFLTDPVWEVTTDAGARVEAHYVGFSRQYETWIVAAPKSRQAGIGFLSGTWQGMDAVPQHSVESYSIHNDVAAALEADLLQLREWGQKRLSDELRQPAWNRSAFMVFCAPDSHASLALRPTSIAVVQQRCKEWNAQWVTHSPDRPPPPLLQELNDVLAALPR